MIARGRGAHTATSKCTYQCRCGLACAHGTESRRRELGRNATSFKAPSRQRATLAHIPAPVGEKEKKKILTTGGHLAPRRPSRALTGSADRMAAIHKVAAPHALAIPSTSTTASQNRAATGEFPAPITSADGLCRIQPRIPMTMSIHQSACVAFRFRASFGPHLRGLGAPPAQQHTAAPGSPGRP